MLFRVEVLATLTNPPGTEGCEGFVMGEFLDWGERRT